MLALTRKAGETIWIGDDIKVTLVHVRGNQARIAIEAPRSVRIAREEIRGRFEGAHERREDEAPAPSIRHECVVC